jgi:hypothetical protein
MLKTCYCGRCQLNTEDTELVVNERPLCATDCISRAREQNRKLRRYRVGGQMVGVRSRAFDVVA